MGLVSDTRAYEQALQETEKLVDQLSVDDMKTLPVA